MPSATLLTLANLDRISTVVTACISAVLGIWIGFIVLSRAQRAGRGYRRLLSGLIIEDVTPAKVIFHYAEVRKTLVQRDAGLAGPGGVKNICREEDIARTEGVSSVKEVAPVANVEVPMEKPGHKDIVRGAKDEPKHTVIASATPERKPLLVFKNLRHQPPNPTTVPRPIAPPAPPPRRSRVEREVDDAILAVYYEQFPHISVNATPPRQPSYAEIAARPPMAAIPLRVIAHHLRGTSCLAPRPARQRLPRTEHARRKAHRLRCVRRAVVRRHRDAVPRERLSRRVLRRRPHARLKQHAARGQDDTIWEP